MLGDDVTLGGGSSPHTRGALARAGLASNRVGIIPAYAGSTSRRPGIALSRPDHPRIRGEHRPNGKDLPLGRGSSPHTRGAPVTLGVSAAPVGIIPAYAGSTICRKRLIFSKADHPRIRGEHTAAGVPSATACGSSPHTRGARRRGIRSRSRARIIPAYAGSTPRGLHCKVHCWDHPRIRGEHGTGIIGGGAAERIIPAYAGSTRRAGSRTPRSGDHPRIRGEHLRIRRPSRLAEGSSPHTRGAHPLPRPERLGRRIIPAYAGSTRLRARTVLLNPDHPRIRGEHRRRRLDPDEHRRIIPAYAGSTLLAIVVQLVDEDHPRIRGEHVDGVEGEQVSLWIIPAYAGSTNSRS